MNKVEELQKKLDQLQKELDKLKKEKDEVCAWRPKVGEKYFSINATSGQVLYAFYNGYSADNARFSIGNVFKTEEEAEFAVEN